MELRHLHYFVHVAEALNYRAAAQTLHVSAPALSRQIKDLEAELGVRLLERNTQTVRLTNSGAVFLAEARKILAQVKAAARQAREAEQGRRGHLRIGTIGRTLAHYLPHCLTTFQARHPDIHVDLAEMDYAEQFAALQAGTLDLGFMMAHTALPPGMHWCRERVLSTPIFALLGRQHPLARARRVALADLARERLLFLSHTKTSLYPEFARTLFSARKFTPREMVEVKGFQTLMAMVAARQGASLIGFEKAAAADPEVVLRPLQDRGPDLKMHFCAVFPGNDHPTARLVQHFIAVLRETIATTVD